MLFRFVDYVDSLYKFKHTMKLFIIVVALLFGNAGYSQTKTEKTTTIPKYKVPKISIILGGFKDSLKIPVEEIKNVIDKPFIVTDGTAMKYKISSYQVLYKQIAVTEDESGKALPTTSVKSSRFSASPLPDIWVKVIKEELMKGEEIMFFDIIVKDEKGRVMYAPNLKFTAL